jgi:hypothetical protein
VELLYSGSSSAILGTNLLNSDIKNLSIDATNATGTSQRGIYLKGAWLCTLKNARVKGIGRADGYGILIDTNAGAHGAQHNYLERCECADGVIRLAGTSGSDAVTTTVLNTIRGFQYEIADSMVTLINATAEGWVTGAGFTFTGFADNLMIGCDIEGAGSPGIDTTGITSGSTREIATIWDGFTGTTRVSGDLADWVFQNSGISLVNIGQAVGNMKGMAWSDKNAAYARWLPSANDVSGGTQDGHMVLQRNNSGAGLTNQLELRRVLRLEHSLAIANVATTVLTIPIPTNVGIRITAHATGIETAAGAFSCWRTCLAVNSGGTVTTTVQAEEEIAAGGATPAFTYTISTTNILVQFNHGSATPTTINFIFEINGAIANYTKA